MANVGNLLNRNVSSFLAAADQTGGTAWVAVNLQTPGTDKVFLTGIDAMVRLSLPAETATITNIRGQIFQNLNLIPTLDINVQTQQGILLWFMDNESAGLRTFTYRFQTPWEIDTNSRYTIVVFPIFSGALASIDAIDLTVLGVYGAAADSQKDYFGKAR